MKVPLIKAVRCAIYTRVSTDHGLDQEFNSSMPSTTQLPPSDATTAMEQSYATWSDDAS
jgi:hypothetical protein